MTAGIFELAVVILMAATLGIAAKYFKQPIVLAYLVTGGALAYFNWTKIINQESFHTFSDLGIMFLLFLVGLEINWSSMQSVGKSAVIIGLGQVIVTFILGYGLAWLFGFTPIHAAYIAFALTISSTVIVVKLLSEKRELHSLSGRLAVGILLVQDAVVILLLVVLTGFSRGDVFSFSNLAVAVTRGIALCAFMVYLGRKLMPHMIHRIAQSTELLFLVSLAWVFLLAAFVQKIGFSIEIAGFLAGISLANASEHFQIAGRIRPLRDFFILIFFVLLGSSIVNVNVTGLTLSVVAFSLFVLIGNPLIVIILAGLMGFRKRTGFLTGLAVAQISEFSLVLAALGREIGQIDDAVVSLITVVGIITITISSYLITHGDHLFRRFRRRLTLFERKMAKEDGSVGRGVSKPIILIGAHRTGQAIAMSVPREQLLVIEFDPLVAAELKNAGFDYLFGDIADPDIFERAHFNEARLVISTNPVYEDNVDLVKILKSLPNSPTVIVRAEEEAEARALYDCGADYVLLPNMTAGQYIGKTIAMDPEFRILEQFKKRDIMMLHNKHRLLAVPPTPPRSP